MRHLFEGVPGLGDVELSRHAREKADAQGITEAQVERVLRDGERIRDGFAVVLCQALGIRAVVLLEPEPDRGRRLVMTVYRLDPEVAALLR